MTHLRQLIPHSPSEILSGPLGEWVTIILLSALFVAIAGAALPKRLTESKTGKSLVTILGIFLGVALYQARDLLNFNYESFGFFSIGLIIVVAFMTMYGLTKFGFKNKRLAFALSYTIIYLTFAMIAPSLYDSFAESISVINGLLAILFILSLGYSFYEGFRAIVPKGATPQDTKTDRRELLEEEKEEGEEISDIKHHTLKLTRSSNKDLDSIRHLMQKIAARLKEQNLSIASQQYIASTLNQISKMKDHLQQSLLSLRQYTQSFRQNDTEHLETLKARLQSATNNTQRKEIRKEIEAEENKLELLNFMSRNDSIIMRRLMDFQQHLHYAVQALKQKRQTEAANHVTAAYQQLGTMMGHLKQMLSWEKHIKSLDKKERKLQRKEEAGR
jgi:hypothetical protein